MKIGLYWGLVFLPCILWPSKYKVLWHILVDINLLLGKPHILKKFLLVQPVHPVVSKVTAYLLSYPVLCTGFLMNK